MENVFETFFDAKKSLFQGIEEDKRLSEAAKHFDFELPPEQKNFQARQPCIVIEGLDGTGKSTLVRGLSERLGMNYTMS